MRRLGRVGRRPDHWDSPHEQARVSIAERMTGELRADEAVWLDEHLEACAHCTSIAALYAADRAALRALRDAAPEPPRDLWARTAAAIEREARDHRTAPGVARGRGFRFPLGALSGIAVIAVVIGVSALSGGFGRPTQLAVPEAKNEQDSTTGGDVNSGPTGPHATPFTVGAGPVAWVDKSASGLLAYNSARVDEVCPAKGTSGCPALKQGTQQRLTFDSEPRTIIDSPAGGPAVMVADDGSGGDQLLLVDLPEGTEAPTTRSALPVPTAADTPAASALASGPPATPAASPAETEPHSPIPPPTTPAPTATPTESEGSDTSAPTSTIAPTPSVTPVVPSPTPSLSPSPAAAGLAIASEIELVGESAAFSKDGSWFAFTARPADGSRGPDVYVWQVGDASARALTDDGSTVFASWDGDQVVASRPAAATLEEAGVSPVTVRIDPTTAVESPAGDMWRPVVDPTRRRAIGWAGTIARSADGTTWTPESGRLEMHPWSVDGARQQGRGQGGGAPVLRDEASAGFDARWDDGGEWVAIWVADPVDPSVGRLSLYQVNASSGHLEIPQDAPTEVPALPGFSIGEGRLAWATPPGQDGEGSRIQIVAWNEDGVGTVESVPGEDLVVIR